MKIGEKVKGISDDIVSRLNACAQYHKRKKGTTFEQWGNDIQNALYSFSEQALKDRQELDVLKASIKRCGVELSECLHCGRTIIKTNSKQKYCNPTCKGNYHKTK